jgi:pSer/pThr/pTyr-binding forkhead associated (FHA) protein
MADVLDVSRNHARLFWSGSDLYVVDLGSLNGTFVDGEPVTVPAPIRPGSRFRVADMEVELVQLDESGIPL